MLVVFGNYTCLYNVIYNVFGHFYEFLTFLGVFGLVAAYSERQLYRRLVCIVCYVIRVCLPHTEHSQVRYTRCVIHIWYMCAMTASFECVHVHALVMRFVLTKCRLTSKYSFCVRARALHSSD